MGVRLQDVAAEGLHREGQLLGLPGLIPTRGPSPWPPASQPTPESTLKSSPPWRLDSGLAELLRGLPETARSAVLARWDVADADPDHFARRLLDSGALAARIRSNPGWRPTLDRLVFAPPSGLPRADVPGPVEALVADGLVRTLDDGRLALPWEVVWAAAARVAEAPPVLAAALGLMDRARLEALAAAVGLDVAGPSGGLGHGLYRVFTTDAAVAALADGLSASAADRLAALLDAGGRPVDPDVIGEPALRVDLDEAAALGLLHVREGAYYIPVDLLDRLGRWRGARIERGFAGWWADRLASTTPGQRPPHGPTTAAGLLRAAAVLDVYAARHGEHRLFDPASTRLWDALAGGQPPARFADMRRLGRRMARESTAEGVAHVDLEPAAVDARALRALLGGFGPVQAPLADLLGVEPFARDLLAIRGARQALAQAPPGLEALFERVVGERLGASGLDLEDVDGLADAAARLVGDWLSRCLQAVVSSLGELPPGRLCPPAVLTELCWLSARRVAAARWTEPSAFARRFAGRPPLQSCTQLARAGARSRAAGLARALVDRFFAPLGLIVPCAEGLFVDPRLAAAVARLAHPVAGRAAIDDAHVRLSVEGEQLLVAWPPGRGAVGSLMACVEQGHVAGGDGRLAFAIDGPSLAGQPGVSALWACMARWPRGGGSSAVDGWMARWRPPVSVRPGVSFLRAESAEALESFLSDGRLFVVERPSPTTAIVIET